MTNASDRVLATEDIFVDWRLVHCDTQALEKSLYRTMVLIFQGLAYHDKPNAEKNNDILRGLSDARAKSTPLELPTYIYR